MFRRDDGSMPPQQDDPLVTIGHGFDLPDENDPAVKRREAEYEEQIKKDQEGHDRVIKLIYEIGGASTVAPEEEAA